MTTNTTTKKKWYNEKSTVILLVFLFPPMGIYGMVKSTAFGIVPKGITYIFLVFMGLIVLGGILAGPPKRSSKPITTTNASISSSKPVERLKKIPGIYPVDVYGNFEKKGFSTYKEGDHTGKFWFNDSESNGITHNVRTYSESGDVNNIRLSATRVNPELNDVESMKPFLKFGCSIPLEGNDIQKINTFIDENYYNNKASIVISDVKFTIVAPTEFARMIDIERE